MLRLILADAVRKKLLAANPVAEWKATLPKGHSSSGPRRMEDGRALDSEERERLLDKAQEVAPDYFQFFLFLAETGCCIREAMHLKWADVDLGAHTARVRTPIEWVRKMGGWSSAKMVLDVYGHFLPTEMRGFSDALAPGDRTRPHQAMSER